MLRLLWEKEGSYNTTEKFSKKRREEKQSIKESEENIHILSFMSLWLVAL